MGPRRAPFAAAERARSTQLGARDRTRGDRTREPHAKGRRARRQRRRAAVGLSGGGGHRAAGPSSARSRPPGALPRPALGPPGRHARPAAAKACTAPRGMRWRRAYRYCSNWTCKFALVGVGARSLSLVAVCAASRLSRQPRGARAPDPRHATHASPCSLFLRARPTLLPPPSRSPTTAFGRRRRAVACALHNHTCTHAARVPASQVC